MLRFAFVGIAAILLTPVLSSSAQDSGQETAIAHSADDPQLEWGPCPEFMPEGCSIAVLQGDPAEPNADVFFKVPGKAEVPEHWHTSAERMVLVSGEMQVTYRGQDPQVLEPGMYAYGPSKHPHEATCISTAPCVLFIAFESPVDANPGDPTSP